MPKVDHPAIFLPGIHSLTLDEFRARTVEPFLPSPKREDLFGKFQIWYEALKACGVTGTLWIDGSFVTQKDSPSDIDCVIWDAEWAPGHEPTEEQMHRVNNLLDKAHARAIYDLDLYMCAPQPKDVLTEESYWRGLFGFCHDRVTAKGFVKVLL